MNLQRRSACFGLLAAVACSTAWARMPSAEVVAELPGAQLHGASPMRFFGLRVYDARLWSGHGGLGADWAGKPFALELEYAREFKGEQIAERSLTEMRRQTEIHPETARRWLQQMKQLFPDVKAGDRLTGVYRPGQAARFFVNGQFKGEAADADFARIFFGIWLAPTTSEPTLRKALLGAAS